MAALRNNGGRLSWGLVCFPALAIMVRVLEFGSVKYAPDNWKKGMNKKRILESMLRHTFALLEGEELDNGEGGSGLHHIGHVLCNAMFYSYYVMNPEKEIPYDVVTDAKVVSDYDIDKFHMIKSISDQAFKNNESVIDVSAAMYLFKLVPTAEYPTNIGYVFPKFSLKYCVASKEAEKILNAVKKYVHIADIAPLLKERVLIMTCERGKFIELPNSTYNYILANELYEYVEVIKSVDNTKDLMADFVVAYPHSQTSNIYLLNLWYSSNYFYEKYRSYNNKGSRIDLDYIVKDLKSGKVKFLVTAKRVTIKVSQTAYDYIKEHQLYKYVKRD